MSGSVVTKYLRAHAEAEASAISLRRLRGLGRVLTVVAHDEGPQDLQPLLGSLRDDAGVLVVLLLNDRTDSTDDAVGRGRALLAHLRDRYGGGEDVGGGASEHATPFGGLLLMRRTADTTPLPAAQGVGLARKIACDVALSLCHRGQLATDLIHNTDADAQLPPDYFERLPPRPGAAFGAVYPFEHVGGEPQLHAAGQLYELSLRHYVLGLQRAGSPYAMHTVGSTLAISAAGYAAVRGFPRRHGAEDFYLLNKLAKVGPIVRIGGAPIALRDRLSTRVPFGTGPAVRRIVGGASLGFHHPASFELLGDFLRGLDRLCDDGRPAPEAAASLASALCPKLAPAVAQRVIEASGVGGALLAARERSASADMRQHVHTYFDAFRTLKWIRALSAEGFEDVDWSTAVGHCPDGPRSVEQALVQLRTLEAVTCGDDVGVAAMALRQ